MLPTTLLCVVISCSDSDCGSKDEVTPKVARQTCESSQCHGVAGSPNGIEEAHKPVSLLCTDCHGGDGTATEQYLAHVAPAPEWVEARVQGYLKNLPVNDLDRVDPAYLRFINPGDYRVAQQSCGSASQQSNGSGCHEDLIYNAVRSNMATFVGHFNVPRFQNGMQDRDAIFGSVALDDPKKPAQQPQGTVPSLQQAKVPPHDAPKDSLDTIVDHYLIKNCTHCHQWNFGRNDTRGNYRSSGCTSCHMVYNTDGITESNDATIPKNVPPHPVKHVLETALPVEQCERCHFQGARIGLLYQGIVEAGFEGQDTATNIEVIDEVLHGHAGGYYANVSGDPRYPADVHYDRGLTCVDCHIGQDVHGNGRIFSTSKYQTAIRCENCHGTVDSVIQEGRAMAPTTPDGSPDETCQPDVNPQHSDYFLTCSGDPIKRMVRTESGNIVLNLASGQGQRPVTQIKRSLETRPSPLLVESMGRNAEGKSHTDIVECSTCHTAYRQYCFGCHVEVDFGSEKKDLVTGLSTPGVDSGAKFRSTLDEFFIGMNRRNKIGSFCPSMAVFFTSSETQEDGEKKTYFERKIRKSATGKRGFNWAINAPHTTVTRSRACAQCHADQENDCSTTKARESYGFGTGRFMETDGDGVTYDLTQLIDEQGTPLVDFSHIDQGAVPIDMIERALKICVTESTQP